MFFLSQNISYRLFYYRSSVFWSVFSIKLKLKEAAKLRALLAKNVFACQRAFCTYVLTCQPAFRVYVLTCLTCSRANVLCVLTFSRANVLCVPTCSRDITTNNKNMFSITSFPYIFVIILCLFPVK